MWFYALTCTFSSRTMALQISAFSAAPRFVSCAHATQNISYDCLLSASCMILIAMIVGGSGAMSLAYCFSMSTFLVKLCSITQCQSCD